MWRAVEIDVRVDHPIDQVFAYLADPTRWHEFAPAVVMRRQLGAGRPRVGTTWAAMDRIGPFKFSFTDELVEHQLNRRVTWHSSAPWNALTEYDCEPDGDSTRVCARYGGDIAGWLRLLGLVPPLVMGWILAQEFRRLGRLLATGRRADAQPLLEAFD
jgi:hypothetical protein